MTVDVLPDAEGVCVAFFAAHPLLASFSGAHVATQIQPSWTGYALRVARVGGTFLDSYADNPRIQLDCWGPTTDVGGADTATFALNVAAAFYDLPGQHANAWIANADILDGPIPEADDNNRPRYRLDIGFELYLKVSP